MPMKFRALSMALGLLLATVPAALQVPIGNAQSGGYRLPPAAVVDLIDAPSPPVEFISPDRRSLLVVEDDDMRSLADLAEPYMKFAGMRVHAQSNSQVRYRYYRRPSLVRLADGRRTSLGLPDDVRLGIPVWSHDGRFAALPSYGRTGVDLWVVDTRSGSVRHLKKTRVNATLSEGYRQINEEHIINMSWAPDNHHVIAPLVLSERGAEPAAPAIPRSPSVHETAANYSRERNWEDLSQNADDDARFEYYSTSQLHAIDVRDGTQVSIGAPGLFIAAPIVSPDGAFILIQRVKKPYSYWVRYREFSKSFEIWDRKGTLIKVIADLPSEDHIGAGVESRELTDLQWQPGQPASLVWIEHGPPHTADSAPEDKSHLLRLSAPFDKAPELLARSRSKFERAEWLQNDPRVLLTETTGSRQWKRSTTWLADLRQPPDSWRKIFNYIEGDLATDPGRPVLERTSRGERLVRQDGSHLYLNGAAESAAGAEPFLDRFNLESGETTRIFRSRPGRYESFLSFTSGSDSDILISHESRLEPRGVRRLDLTSGRDTALILPSNPYPKLNGVERRLVTYPRSDGVNLSGSLYIPADHKPGERLPLVIWAYPTEYADKRIAGQIRVNSNRFMDLGFANQQQFRHLVTQGYLVLDMAEMPVVGDSRTRNDTYREQIVASAQAAIEHLDSLGLIDPRRVGIGGHSYGGFSAANQLTSSKLFAAGVATSGSFNRTMDPWGFHAEPRTLWQVPEKYFDVSPLMRADQITAPLLLIHGEADDSQSSKPAYSYRMFHALRGLGSTARLVLLPLENHHYSARETRLHVAAETIEWFDLHLKSKPSE